jgi:hypothetical protein
MKFKFKIIPFLISLLIVVGVTFGICWYSYHDYPLNKYDFYEEYFHKEDYKNYQSSELIENAVKFQYEGYKKASNTISALENTEVQSTYNNGTISVPGYFDIDIYLTVSDSNGEKTYSYYFYFYNVNYQDSTLDPLNEIGVIIVNGIGEGVAETEDDEEFGSALLETAISNLGDDNDNNNPSYNALAAYGYTANSARIYPIFDTGYSSDNKVDTTADHYVWRCSPRLDYSHTEITDKAKFADGEATFAIVDFGGKTVKSLFKGTMTGINKMSEVDYDEGYNEDPTKSYYGSVVFPKVLLHGGIAFVISAVIAFLFYLLWLDPKEETKKTVKIQQKKKK